MGEDLQAKLRKADENRVKKEQERLKPAKQTLALVEERREKLRELEERKALELRNIIQAKNKVAENNR